LVHQGTRGTSGIVGLSLALALTDRMPLEAPTERMWNSVEAPPGDDRSGRVQQVPAAEIRVKEYAGLEDTKTAVSTHGRWPKLDLPSVVVEPVHGVDSRSSLIPVAQRNHKAAVVRIPVAALVVKSLHTVGMAQERMGRMGEALTDTWMELESIL
jgi:hypothetical protein